MYDEPVSLKNLYVDDGILSASFKISKVGSNLYKLSFKYRYELKHWLDLSNKSKLILLKYFYKIKEMKYNE